MRKGHRRTQSANISSSTQVVMHLTTNAPAPVQIIQLLEASENKMDHKIVNYDKLDISNEQRSKFLNFGNATIAKYNRQHYQPELAFSKLNCIPETSRSSQISSQPLSSHGDNIQTYSREENVPVRKVKRKRRSDFKRLQNQQKESSDSNIQNSEKRSRSLKKRINE